MDDVVDQPDLHASPVAVLLSGGVDSSVAALLLKEQGCRVTGVTMRIAQAGGDGGQSALLAAGRVCEALGVAHRVLDVSEAFAEMVVRPFCDGYRQGRTPNPCVLCNPAIKFGMIRERVQSWLGIARLATGHYARISRGQRGLPALARASHHARDQSYFLYRVRPEWLSQVSFPLGEIASKDETRRIAREAGLPVAERKDSMEACFVPGNDYRDLLGHAAGPGPIFDCAGSRVGEHPGYQNFTVGQRRWLGKAFGRPMYVLRIMPADNAIVIGPREAACCREVKARDLVVHLADSLADGERLFGKVRSGGEPRPCEVESLSAACMGVRFCEPVFAPTPGQHLVLYDAGGRLVAGGEICGAQGGAGP